MSDRRRNENERKGKEEDGGNSSLFRDLSRLIRAEPERKEKEKLSKKRFSCRKKEEEELISGRRHSGTHSSREETPEIRR